MNSCCRPSLGLSREQYPVQGGGQNHLRLSWIYSLSFSIPVKASCLFSSRMVTAHPSLVQTNCLFLCEKTAVWVTEQKRQRLRNIISFFFSKQAPVSMSRTTVAPDPWGCAKWKHIVPLAWLAADFVLCFCGSVWETKQQVEIASSPPSPFPPNLSVYAG